MRIKHNKKRNTAFLYEALVREMAKSVLKKNKPRKDKIIKILKEHFNGETSLKRELDIYHSLMADHTFDPPTAERLLWEAKNDYNTK